MGVVTGVRSSLIKITFDDFLEVVEWSDFAEEVVLYTACLMTQYVLN